MFRLKIDNPIGLQEYMKVRSLDDDWDSHPTDYWDHKIPSSEMYTDPCQFGGRECMIPIT